MFKLESYVTPLLFSYVDKYIKNFRPEDSQVSLWGGEAAFSNLDLRLEVLEQELHLPFTFVSGHIHELRILVPWTKLASEPIVVTINTIECTLKLHDESDSDSSSGGSYKRESKKDAKKKRSSYEMNAPPGYIQSLISKVVSNISIVCNNLILKYVEEDIVLSVNVKTVSMVSADSSWQPAFSELTAPDLTLRKLASLSDLTVCLDRRGASGKIEAYQEPLLYRCSLSLHLAQCYHSLLAKRPRLTRIDVCCSKMDFSLTDLQLPMLIRLIRLALALYLKELVRDTASRDGSPEQEGTSQEVAEESDAVQSESWTGWAMSWVPTLLPLYWEEETEEEGACERRAEDAQGTGRAQIRPPTNVLHLGCYIHQAGLTLKVTDSGGVATASGVGSGGVASVGVTSPGTEPVGGSSGSKLRFTPYACLHLQGLRTEVICRAKDAVLAQVGVGHVSLDRMGDICLCGVRDKLWGKSFVTSGLPQSADDFRRGSLFDLTSTTPLPDFHYEFTWDSHLHTVTEASLLERSPAFALDYLYVLDLPDEYDSDLESDLEFSNLPERALCRVVVGPAQVRVDSNFLHACQMAAHSASAYDYAPYGRPRLPGSLISQLDEHSLEEELRLLESNCPVRVYQVTVFKPVVLLSPLADHPTFDPSTRRKRWGGGGRSPFPPILTAPLPTLSLECECLDARLTQPMYPERLIRALTSDFSTNLDALKPSPTLMQRCHLDLDLKVFGAESRLRCDEWQAPVLLPCNVNVSLKELLRWDNWTRSPHKDATRREFTLEAGSLTLTGSKPHTLTAWQILTSLTPPHHCLLFSNSSLVHDLTSSDTSRPSLQLQIRAIDLQATVTADSTSYQLSVGELEVSSVVRGRGPGSDHQVALLAGPSEEGDQLAAGMGPLVTALVQLPDKEGSAVAVMYLATKQVSCYMADGLYNWMAYKPKLIPPSKEKLERTLSSTSATAGPSSAGSDSQRIHHQQQLQQQYQHHHRHHPKQQQQPPVITRGHHHPRESVHSSDKLRDSASVPALVESSAEAPSGGHISPGEGSAGFKNGWREICAKWIPLLGSPLVCIHLEHWTIHLPANISSDSLPSPKCGESAVVLCLPRVEVRNTVLPPGSVEAHLFCIPVRLPRDLWPPGREGFPLKLNLSDFSCSAGYNLGGEVGKEENYLLHPISTTCTLAVTNRKNDPPSQSPLGLCLHADMGTLHISLNMQQAEVFTHALDNLLRMSFELFDSSWEPHSGHEIGSASLADLVTPPPLIPLRSNASVSEPTTPQVTTETEEDDIAKATACGGDDVKSMTLWVQWTLTNLILTMYGAPDQQDRGEPRAKVTAQVEDIVTSIDLQQVFLKVKLKVAAANIQHFRRVGKDGWRPGSHLGVLLSCGEDVTSDIHVWHPLIGSSGSSPGSDGGGTPSDDSPRSGVGVGPPPPPPPIRSVPSHPALTRTTQTRGLLSLTFTRAQVHSVHEKWQQLLRRHLDEEWVVSGSVSGGGSKGGAGSKAGGEVQLRHLSELDVELRPIDVILSAEVMRPFLDVLQAWAKGLTISRSPCPDVAPSTVTHHRDWLSYNNNTLPMLYLKTKGMRIFLPLTKGNGAETNPDMVLVQLESATLTSQVDNPLGHVFVRPDIYRTAEQARILGIPGAEVEDRQYQLDVVGLCAGTGQWEKVEYQSSRQSPSAALRTMGENPALDWNSLDPSSVGFNSEVLLLPVLSRLQLRVMAAPAIVYEQRRLLKQVLVCGHSLELNAVSDVLISASLPQLRLLCELASDLAQFGGALLGACGGSKKASVAPIHQDSGVDCDSTGMSSSLHLPPPQPHKLRHTELVPTEILLTGARITLTLYDIGQPQKLPKKKPRKTTRIKGCSYEEDSDESYYASEEESVSKLEMEGSCSWQEQAKPLVYVMVSQPHTFISVLPCAQKMEMSFFDVAVKMAHASHLVPLTKTKQVPRPEDFSLHFFETKHGDPHPKTGIPPALITLTIGNLLRKPYQVRLELGRPWKVHLSPIHWEQLLSTSQKILSCFPTSLITSNQKSSSSHKENTSVVAYLRSSASNVSMLTLAGQQGMLSLKSGGEEEGPEEGSCQIVVAFASIKGGASCFVRPHGFQVDRVSWNLAVRSLIVNVALNQRCHSFLSPWSFNLESSLFWEPWMLDPNRPVVQITADSEPILLDLGPDHVTCFHIMKEELQEMFGGYSSAKAGTPQPALPTVIQHEPANGQQEQHYQDDLRAGAFQYAESCDPPLPYQLVFTPQPSENKDASIPPSMGWRYPQPRCLTRVDIHPLPFREGRKTEEHKGRAVGSGDEIVCALQYWDEAQGGYRTYCRFALSESHRCRLQLPALDDSTKVAVAAMWRVCLDYREDDDQSLPPFVHVRCEPLDPLDIRDVRMEVMGNHSWRVSPRALAGCMRVDSYFSPSLVPWIQLAAKFPLLRVTLRNHLHTLSPGYVSGVFKRSSPPVLDQGFTWASAEKGFLHLCMWPSTHSSPPSSHASLLLSLSTHFRWDVLDYAFLTHYDLLESFSLQGSLSIAPSQVEVNVVANPARIKVGQSGIHTLTASALCWQAANKRALAPVLTHYVICNDTSQAIRVGQVDTDESIVVASREAVEYCWRSQREVAELRAGAEVQGGATQGPMTWCGSFRTDHEGELVRLLDDCGTAMIVRVDMASGTQKQVTIMGQTTFVNLLSEPLCIRILGDAAWSTSIWADPHHQPASLLIDPGHIHCLRFSLGCSTDCSSAPGANDVSEEVPMHTDRPVSIRIPSSGSESCNAWCSIFKQEVGNGEKGKVSRMLVVLSPLYRVRSHLPLPARLTVSTPGVGASREVTVPGRNRAEELRCLGTVEHAHQLTFRLGKRPISVTYVVPPLPCSCSTLSSQPKLPDSSPAVPLSCGMASQFQPMTGQVDISAWLKDFHSRKETTWPLVSEKEDGIVQWVEAAQPDTDVQVHFSQAYPSCPTVQVELKPWTLMANLSGSSIFLKLKEDGPLWECPSRGVLALSRLQEKFQIGFKQGGEPHFSEPVVLSEEEWSPHDQDSVPLDGSAPVWIEIEGISRLLILQSSVAHGMRILCIRPAFAAVNHTQQEVHLAGILDWGGSTVLPEPSHSVLLPPSPKPYGEMCPGQPLLDWAVVGHPEQSQDPVFHVQVRVDSDWSCPVDIGLSGKEDTDMRHVVQAPTVGETSNVALAITVHRRGRRVFLSVAVDGGVQMVIHNRCSFALHYAQGGPEASADTSLTVRGLSRRFSYWPSVHSRSSASYTFPWMTDCFPGIQASPGGGSEMPKLLLAKAPLRDDDGTVGWSRGVDVRAAYDQFVGLPGHGDVKVMVDRRGHVTHVTVEQVSRIEVSAKEIRSRLQSNIPATERAEPNKEEPAPLHFSSSHPTTPVNREPSPELSGMQLTMRLFLCRIEVVLTDDLESSAMRNEVLALTISHMAASLLPRADYNDGRVRRYLDLGIIIGDLQLDNQMYPKGFFDFPVVVIRETDQREEWKSGPKLGENVMCRGAEDLVEKMQGYEGALLRVGIVMPQEGEGGVEEVEVTLHSFSLYLEHEFYQALRSVEASFTPKNLVPPVTIQLWDPPSDREEVLIPCRAVASSYVLSSPLRLEHLRIQPLSVVLTLRASPGLYLALDHSPLHFSAWERTHLVTTGTVLGAGVGRHYLYEAVLFESGWLLSSLELLGSPGAMARGLGLGLRDLVRHPYHEGLLQGSPWGLALGLAHGCASLFRHVAAGTLVSVTNLASSVARNLDRMSMDREHLQRTEARRRTTPSGVLDGLMQGLSGFGVSLLGAVGGLAHHPMAEAMESGISAGGVARGVGRGIVGAVTKPLGGAAELVARAGRGLLSGAGWSHELRPVRQPEGCPISEQPDSKTKYEWRMEGGGVVQVVQATKLEDSKKYVPVTLVLTHQALVIDSWDQGGQSLAMSIVDVECPEQQDPTLLVCSYQPRAGTPESTTFCEDFILDYVRGSAVHFSPGSDAEAVESLSSSASGEEVAGPSTPHTPVAPPPPFHPLSTKPAQPQVLYFYLGPHDRSSFLSAFNLAKRQTKGLGFPMLSL